MNASARTVLTATALAALVACGGGDSGVTGGGERFVEQTTVASVTPTSVATTTTSGATPARLQPASAEATATAPPGTDATGAVVTYAAANLVDGNPATAWRVAGAGQGVVLTLRFANPVVVTRIGLIPGYAKIDPADGTNRFLQNRRVRRVRYGAGTVAQEASFVDRPEMQSIDLRSSPTREVTIQILESSPPGDRDFTAISEIEVIGLPG